MSAATNLPAFTSAQTPPTRGFRRTLRYCSRFGIRTGMQVARVHRRSTEAMAVRLPELPHPLWMRPGSSDGATFDEVFVSREYDLPLGDFSPRHILDLGANVGLASVLFATRWPQASILAVEPAAENVVLLQRNTAPYPRINVLQAAVWPWPAELSLANPQDDANAFRMTEACGNQTAAIRAFTIPQLRERLGTGHIDLLKMDVEGAEAEILRGAADWMGGVSVMVVELHDRLVPGCGEALCAALHGRRFRQEIVGQNLVIDLRPIAPPGS